jgi:mevalonate kinase
MTQKKKVVKKKKKVTKRKPKDISINIGTTITMDNEAQQALSDENTALLTLLHEINSELLATKIQLTKTKQELDKLKNPSTWTYSTVETEK